VSGLLSAVPLPYPRNEVPARTARLYDTLAFPACYRYRSRVRTAHLPFRNVTKNCQMQPTCFKPSTLTPHTSVVGWRKVAFSGRPRHRRAPPVRLSTTRCCGASSRTFLAGRPCVASFSLRQSACRYVHNTYVPIFVPTACHLFLWCIHIADPPILSSSAENGSATAMQARF